MELKTYLKELGSESARAEFAKRCGTSIGHLRNIIYCGKSCREALAIEIEIATNGAVRCEDLRPDVNWGYLRGTQRKAA